MGHVAGSNWISCRKYTVLIIDFENAISLDTAKKVAFDTGVKKNLICIHHIFSFMIKILESLWNRHLSIFEIIDCTVEKLNHGRGKVADAEELAFKNPGYEELKICCWD